MLELSTLRAKTVTVTDRAGNVLYTLPTTVGEPGQGLRLDAQMNLVWSDMAKFMEDVKAIAAGDYHTVFLKNDGTVWAVGRNNRGQLGDGTTDNKFTPVQVLNGVKAIAAGGLHTVFLKNDDTVWAVGRNSSGQLGDGSTDNKSTPVQVKKSSSVDDFFTGVKAIAAGRLHTVFLMNDETVWSVGSNYYGQLGNGENTNIKSTPVKVLISDVKAIAAGEAHTVFLKNDDTVWAVGSNLKGQLGDGSTDNKSTPVQVLNGVKAIAAGGNHTVFLKNDKTVWAVGYNDQGQLGNGKSGGIRWDEDTMSIIPAEKEVTPVPVMADADNVLTNVKAIAAGFDHTVFLKNDETVWSVGNNGYGQLGDGTTADAKFPVQVLNGVKAIAAGGLHTVFLKSDKTVWAVGYNYYGQLGNGTTDNKSTPVQVSFE